MSPASRTRLIVVDADSSVRQGLARELGSHPALEVVATAINMRTAEPKVTSYHPDLVVLDLVSDADEAIAMLGRFAERGQALRVLGVAAEDTAEQTVRAAAKAGCSTVVRRKPSLSPQDISELAARIGEAIAGAPAQPGRRRAAASEAAVVPFAVPFRGQDASGAPAPVVPRKKRIGIQTPTVVGIGVSTGGPAALQQVIPALPADFPLPIVIVQHMPRGFTKSLAESLDKAAKLRVREAAAGDVLKTGEVLIAPGGTHLRVDRRDGRLVTELTEDPPECSCRPSVDYLFRSLAAACGSRVLGVVLTGMGEDGWIGSRILDAGGACLLAQDEATCTVYGMPRGPVEHGIATAVALPEMAAAIDRAARSASCS